MKAQYFIEVDTYWQNSASYFVGPFASREEAAAWVDSRPDESNLGRAGQMAGDIRYGWRVFPAPLSKTAASKRGMRHEFVNRAPNVLPADTEASAAGIVAAVERLHNIYRVA